MAIRAALNAARWLLPLALVAIIKMHYNPHSLASSHPPSLPTSSLYPVATGSFPLGDEPLIFSSFRASASSSASRPFLRLFTLYVAENSILTTATPLVPSSLLPSISRYLPFLLYTGGHFQFKFASAEERGAFHRRAHACPDSIKDERFDIWLTFRQAHVNKVHRCWDKSLFPSRYAEFQNPLVFSQVPWLINILLSFPFSLIKC